MQLSDSGCYQDITLLVRIEKTVQINDIIDETGYKIKILRINF